MSDFEQALAHIEGHSRAAEFARASLQAARAKFAPLAPEPVFAVSVLGALALSAYDTSVVSRAVQDATGKVSHMFRDPNTQITSAMVVDREMAQLTQRAQIGNTLYFSFPVTTVDDALFLDKHHVASLAETAVRELCNVLPSGLDDDTALDAVLAQRVTIRNAVSDLVAAVTSLHHGLSLELDAPGTDAQVKAVLSADQAGVLKTSLKESKETEHVRTVEGTLDGLRTRRRIFYLEVEGEPEISGAIDPELMPALKDHLGQQVVATLRETRKETVSGKKAHPFYRLTALSEPAVEQTFDDLA